MPQVPHWPGVLITRYPPVRAGTPAGTQRHTPYLQLIPLLTEARSTWEKNAQTLPAGLHVCQDEIAHSHQILDNLLILPLDMVVGTGFADRTAEGATPLFSLYFRREKRT